MAVLPLLDLSRVEPKESVELEEGDFALIRPSVDSFRVYTKVGARFFCGEERLFHSDTRFSGPFF
jgi:hypothetical protein